MSIKQNKEDLKESITKTELESIGLRIEDEDLYEIHVQNQKIANFKEGIIQTCFGIIIILGTFTIGVLY